MKTVFPLSRDGYVTAYLVAPPRVLPFVAPYALKDQLAFEREMRNLFYEEPGDLTFSGGLGELSEIGTPWCFYAKNRNPYIDYSIFYFTLSRVNFLAKTLLLSDAPRSVRVRVWSYAAFDLYLNGKRLATERTPVYQPIRYTDLVLPLEKGENELAFYIQNFGVRDTRNMLSVCLLDTEGISTALPTVREETARALADAEEWFCALRVRGDSVVAPYAPPISVTVSAGKEKGIWSGGTAYPIGDAFAVSLSGEVCGQSFSREFERYEKKLPERRPYAEENIFLESCRTADRKWISEVDELGPVYGKRAPHLRAGVALTRITADPEHRILPSDVRAIRETLVEVRKRSDCADFSMLALLRLLIHYELPAELCEEIRTAALDFRYWMDEDGADAMCFWSENHALTFYVCAALAGRAYPDAIFLRSGRSGREQEAVALRRIGEWFDVICEEGFEEFLAGGYMGVTLSAALAVHDHFPEPLRSRAASVIDRILREAALQCFDGVHFAPMGRIYRGALFPCSSELQGLLYHMDPSCVYTSAAFPAFALSDYRLPSDLRELIHAETEQVYTSGRAEIHTRKTADYMLTSVASPRKTPPAPCRHTDTEYYRTLLMNEGFHGTSLFEPGKGGYQQHLMYAALSDRFYTFLSLPGSERDFCGMRPGYWYGNLVFPALRQKGSELFCRYRIPDSLPTKFTHAYYPTYAADELSEQGGFRFARVGDGYMALWCSVPLVLHEADAVVGADLRAYGDDIAWYIRVGSRRENGSFDDFIRDTLAKGIDPSMVAKALEQ